MQEMTLKNLNNRLLCDTFLHIAAAPGKTILESTFPIPVKVSEPSISGPVSLTAINVSSPEVISFEADIIDIARMDLLALSSLITVPASGMDREMFIKSWLADHPNATMNDKMAIYIFKKR